MGRSAALQLDQSVFRVLKTERLYKTRPRNLFQDPITGVSRQFQVPEVTSLNPVVNKPNFALSVAEKMFQRY